MFNITEYIAGGLTLIIIVGYTWMDSTIDGLNAEKGILKEQLLVAKTNQWTLETSIRYQNEEIKQMAVDLNESTSELTSWRNKEPEIKYEVVYNVAEKIVIKYRDRNITVSEECNASKDVNHAIKSVSFDSL